MALKTIEFERLSSREGFNRSLRHFKLVMEVISEMENQYNVADTINSLISEKKMESSQTDSVLSALLVDKYSYKYDSCNLKKTLTDFTPVYEETSKWNAVDLVLAYSHPELGLIAINPKNKSHWDVIQDLRRNELIIIYAGFFGTAGSDKLAEDAVNKMINLLEGSKFKTPAAFLKGNFKLNLKKASVVKEEKKEKIPTPQPGTKAKAPEKTPEVKTEKGKTTGIAKRKMTPMYSIPVTNELFHNGNVEAWKKIIQSYKARNAECEVLIFYDGERINDINTLFKWGKVKHGSAILISVVGEVIQDVAKLQKYLRQGAGPGFEAFLKFPVNTVLNLF